MKKLSKIVGVILAVAVVAVFIAPGVKGDELSDAKARRNEIQQELRDSEARLKELKDNVANAQQAVDEIDQQISAVQEVIDDYQAQSDEKQKKIDKLQKKIDEKQKEIDREYENMKLRIQFLYENMGNSYLEAFFTSDSFADALNRIQYLLELNNYDRAEMNKLKELQAYIKKEQDAVKKEQDAILELKSAQEEQMAVLDEILAVKAEALGDALDEETKQREQNEYLEELLKDIKQEILSMTTSYDEASGGYVPTSGSFLWPVASPYGPNYITSWYGYRDDPWGRGWTEFHNGLDVGAPGGTPIYAVDDGQVVISQDAAGACGNYTIIYHGGGIYTEYMHQSRRAVSVGQYVSQGDIIGYVGTTGNSTGNHLHFGVMLDHYGVSGGSRVDPCPYLGLY